MYKKNTTLKLILFFVVITVAGQTTLYAGEIPGAVKFKTSDPRSYSAQGHKAMTKKSCKKRVAILGQNIAQAAQQEKQIKRNIAQAKQENTKVKQKIEAERVHVQNLEAKLASEPVGSEQKSFFANKLAQAKQKIASLQQMIIDNKEKIAVAAVMLGAGFLAYKGLSTEDLPSEDSPFEKISEGLGAIGDLVAARKSGDAEQIKLAEDALDRLNYKNNQEKLKGLFKKP